MTTAPDLSGPVVTLHGEAELLARAGHLFAPSSEFLCAAHDLATWSRSGGHDRPQDRLRAQLRLREQLGRGQRIRKLYNPSALADPDSEQHLLDLAADGVPVRICATELAHETIIIDRKVAVLAGPAVAGVRDYTVIRSPEVIAGVHSLFAASWDAGTALTDFVRRRPPEIRPADREILRLLGAGRKDEAAARELGLSVRTYRRRVAELMTALGAESRFQAGARARELGLHA